VACIDVNMYCISFSFSWRRKKFIVTEISQEIQTTMQTKNYDIQFLIFSFTIYKTGYEILFPCLTEPPENIKNFRTWVLDIEIVWIISPGQTSKYIINSVNKGRKFRTCTFANEYGESYNAHKIIANLGIQL
jgi:hypothetical protein